MEPQYIERYKVLEKAILSKYPDINIVSGAGPYAKVNISIMHGRTKAIKDLH
jgi:hypothetical protein